MRDIIYHVATSMDGFIASPDGSADGFLQEGQHIPDYLEELKSYDTVIMGKSTYTFGFDFGLIPGEAPYPWMDQYIFSKTLPYSNKPNLTFVKEGISSVVPQLKEKDGTAIYLCGGGQFAASLLREKLIDRIKLKLNPVVFGSGISLFEEVEENLWSCQLKDTKVYDSGVVILDYVIYY